MKLAGAVRPRSKEKPEREPQSGDPEQENSCQWPVARESQDRQLATDHWQPATVPSIAYNCE